MMIIVMTHLLKIGQIKKLNNKKKFSKDCCLLIKKGLK